MGQEDEGSKRKIPGTDCQGTLPELSPVKNKSFRVHKESMNDETLKNKDLEM